MAQRKVNRKQAQIEKMQATLASLEEEIEALRRAAGDKAVALIRREPLPGDQRAQRLRLSRRRSRAS